MTVVHLRRIDPAKNMHRFYRLDVQPGLFNPEMRAFGPQTSPRKGMGPDDGQALRPSSG